MILLPKSIHVEKELKQLTVNVCTSHTIYMLLLLFTHGRAPSHIFLTQSISINYAKI